MLYSFGAVQGSEYVVMECIVLKGGSDIQLQLGDVVILVQVEPSGASLRVRTTNADPIEGTVPTTFLQKDSTNGMSMVWLLLRNSFQALTTSQCVKRITSPPPLPSPLPLPLPLSLCPSPWQQLSPNDTECSQ